MAVWDVVITSGQSQMSGNPGPEGRTSAPRTNPAKALEWNTGPGLVEIHDDVSSSGAYKAQTGSPIPAFANAWNSLTGRNLLVVRAAVGGSSLLVSNKAVIGGTTWDTTGGTLMADSISRYNSAVAALTALGHTVGNVFVIWSQGYRDAQGGNNLNLYEAANAALLSRWRTGLSNSSVRVYQELMYAPAAATPTVAARCLQIRDAQLASYASTPGLLIGFEEGAEYADKGWLASDQLHYNQTGLNNMGFKFAEKVSEDLDLQGGGTGEPPVIDPVVRTSGVGRLLGLRTPLPSLPRDYSTPGTFTWICPFGITAVKIEVWGAGGGGRGGVSLGRGGNGGGGGEYRVITSQAVTPGQEYSITVGTGGVGGAFNANNGGTGGSSSFASLITANGGGSPTTGSTTGAGGTGGTGGTGTAGDAGAFSVNASNSDGGAGGKGGGAGGGAGGAGGTSVTFVGSPGSSPGGGGGGGKGNSVQGLGGAGANGLVRITPA